MKRYTTLFAALCLAAFPCLSYAEVIKVATWNIEHLRAENNIGAVKRTDADYEALAVLAEELDADIVALQEVDGPEAAARVFDPTEYNFFFSDRNDVQRTGFAVRRTIEVVADEDFVELSLDGSVRRGTDITVKIGDQHLRLLSLHLKSRCFHDPLDTDNRHCRKLAAQLPVLESWIDARTQENVPFIVLGDFNRRFDAAGDEFFPEIDDGAPAPLDLVRAVEGQESDCLGGRFPIYIDHIVLDEQAAVFMVDGSFEQIQITEADEEIFALSDHCPIAVQLSLRATTDSTPAETAERLFKEIRALVKETNEKVEQLHALIPELKQ
jgi:endonuclease/exonuclease/phosphatase family metal-dependent hydrolase